MSNHARAIAGRIQNTASGVLSSSGSTLDRYLPRERRAELWARIKTSVSERPILSSFLLLQILISGPVLVFFTTLTVGALVFSLLGFLSLLVVGAITFLASVLGFGFVFLLPTLFFTTILASVFWIWIFAGFLALRFVHGRMPKDMRVYADISSEVLTEKGRVEGDGEGVLVRHGSGGEGVIDDEDDDDDDDEGQVADVDRQELQHSMEVAWRKRSAADVQQEHHGKVAAAVAVEADRSANGAAKMNGAALTERNGNMDHAQIHSNGLRAGMPVGEVQG